MTATSPDHGVLGKLDLPLGLGLLRLSTEGRPSEADAIAVIHFALDQGIRILDTADSYALDDRDLHYGERLVRHALDTWHGPRAEVRVITKAGLARPKGRWVPNGRREHLRKTVEGSLAALGVERIFMLLLHANDPKTPLEESLGALAELQKEGKIEHLGLCNTSIAELRQAERHFPVRAIQNELSVIDRSSGVAGLVALARQLGVPFLAHRPLGGHAKTGNLLKNRAVKPIAARHGVTPHEAALAALLDLGAPVIPLFGATRRASVESSLRALKVPFDARDRAELATKISFAPTPDALAATAPPLTPAGLPGLAPGAGPGDDPEVVVMMGIQGAGKSSEVARYLERGYARLNRDALGGELEELIPRLAELLAARQRRVVLDNTYATRASRYSLIRTAHAHGVPVRCRYLATPIDEAYANVVLRILERYGRLLGPEELKELAKDDPNLPPPAAMARFAASFEAPHVDEGFSVVEEVPFVRRVAPQFTGKGLLLDVDGTLRKTKSGEIFPRSAEDVELLPGRRELLQRFVDEGYQLFLVSNQSGVASGTLSKEAAEAGFARTIDLLGLPVAEVAYCPHPAFPVGCFCRKPLPGLGVALMQRHRLAREHLIMVGDMDSDRDFARALGARYFDADEFFAVKRPAG
ncbi:MAG: HAD-IIIA family hydrolase [Nannocystis sp.]|uniref:aldo/keto reductase n=1 Tax=Nannocystis sp. TaxID=1962667 RepID=UPI0024282A31|nr:aldo/keto reductase [Nannocystis sp.]MBK9756086.1 HAD-IIIA family hydrolase [Nannocystis sp.]